MELAEIKQFLGLPDEVDSLQYLTALIQQHFVYHLLLLISYWKQTQTGRPILDIQLFGIRRYRFIYKSYNYVPMTNHIIIAVPVLPEKNIV